MQTRVLVLLMLGCGLCRADHDAEVAPIRVVHSWSDLLTTKPLAVKDDNHIVASGDDRRVALSEFDVASIKHPLNNNHFAEGGANLDVASSPLLSERVWIGIDRNRATSKSGVVLYCASQGVVFRRTTPNDLGPFHVAITPEPITQEATFEDMPPVPHNFQGSTYVLAAHSIPLDEPGDYVIELDERQGRSAVTKPRVYARATVHVAGRPAQAWLAWDEPPVPVPAVEPAANDEVVNAYVSNPVTGFAVPKASVDARFYPAQMVPYVALPQLIPRTENSGAHLSLMDGVLVLEAKDLCWPQPKERCLTRWWINDKAYLPASDATDFVRAFQGSGGHSLDDVPTAIRFHWSFVPERMGAKKGDKIGVQLLYCPGGIDRCAVPEADPFDTELSAPEVPPENFSSLSNRIDFIYSGDPMKPVTQ